MGAMLKKGKTANPSLFGNYLPTGNYRLRINRISYVECTPHKSHEIIFLHVEILESDTKTAKVGDEYQIAFIEAYFGVNNFITFLMETTGCDLEEAQETEKWEKIWSDKQPFEDKQFYVKGTDRKSKEGNTYTTFKYSAWLTKKEIKAIQPEKETEKEDEEEE